MGVSPGPSPRGRRPRGKEPGVFKAQRSETQRYYQTPSTKQNHDLFTMASGSVAMLAPAYQALPNPVVVVGPQFLSPYPVDLTVVKKVMTISDGNFAVTDVNGTIIFKVKGALLTLHDRRMILDAADRPIVSLQSKVPPIIF